MKKKSEKKFLQGYEELVDQAEKWMHGSLMQKELSDEPDGEESSKILAEKTITEATKDTLSFEEQGEQQLMHALLTHQHESELSHNSYVDRGMRLIDGIDGAEQETLPARPISFRAKVYALSGGLAASVIFCLSVFFLAFPSTSAMAAMDEVISHIDGMGDRLYSLRVEKVKRGKNAQFSQINDGIEPLSQKDKWNDRKGKRSSKPRFEKAELYLRGADQFVFMEQREDGRGFIKGSNGQESWQINGNGSGLITGDQDSTKLPLSRNSGTLAFSNIAKSLRDLKEGYDISMLENQVLPDLDGLWTKIVAEKIDRNTKGVKRVILYFDPANYYIQRLIFDRVHLPGDRALMKITMDLQSTNPLPIDFFEYSTHYTLE